MADDKTYTLQEIADAAGETPRTIRYYISRGLLPPPGRGRDARYTQAHLDRLATIKEQQGKGISLDGIKIGLQLPGPWHTPAPWAGTRPEDHVDSRLMLFRLLVAEGGDDSIWSRDEVKKAVMDLVRTVKEEG